MRNTEITVSIPTKFCTVI